MTELDQHDAPDQNEMIRNVAMEVLETAPQGWRELTLTFLSTIHASQSSLNVLDAQGDTKRLKTPRSALSALEDLRTAMYQPGKGTWFKARVTVIHPGRYSADFDYDTEPAFEPQLTPESFARDLERFPRSEELTPGWLRRMVADASPDTDGPATPRFSPQFEELATRHAGLAVHQSLMFAGEVTAADWRYDIAASTFTVGDRSFSMTPLGTTIPGPDVFVWCWADSSLEQFPQAIAASWKLRMFGYEHDIPEFVTGGVPIGAWGDLDEGAKRLGLVALGVLGGRGCHGFRMHHGGGFYVLTDDPALPEPAEPEPELVDRVLKLAAEYFPQLDQMEVAAKYVEALGGRWSQIPGGLTVRFGAGGMSLHYAGNALQWIGPSMG